MIPNNEPDIRLLLAEIMPWVATDAESIMTEGMELVHYTSAPAVHSILETEKIWLRSASCMNDMSEIEYGVNTFFEAAYSEDCNEWCELVCRKYPDLLHGLENLFRSNLEGLTYMTFLACFSTHDDAERKYGRLSMWRAYTEGNGMALVIDAPSLINQMHSKPWWLVRVSYDGVEGVKKRLSKMAGAMASSEALNSAARSTFYDAMAVSVLSIIVSCKHPAFREEQEWRIVYSETGLTHGHDQGAGEFPQRQLVRGVPQMVYTLPLSLGGDGPLLRRIMIGPTQYFGAMREALIHHLRSMEYRGGMPDITSCEVPLRLNG